jgi:hypothetical protein
VKLPQARTSASPVALRTKTDAVGAKACQRARHIRSYRTALRPVDRGRNDVQPVPDFPLAFDPSGRGLRCPDPQQSVAGIAVRTRRRSCGRGAGVRRQGSRTWVRRRAAAGLIRTGRGSGKSCGAADDWGARLGIGFNGLDLILRAQHPLSRCRDHSGVQESHNHCA